MKTTLTLPIRICLFTITVLSTTADTSAQNFRGKDGAANFTSSGTYVLNRYTTLASSENAGSLSITVTNIADLSGATSFTNSVNAFSAAALGQGDLVMIMQVQGADITTTDDANYGAITAYNNTGSYEVRTVYGVTNNTIFLCQNLAHTYTVGDRNRTQVIRIPRLSSLNISSGVTLTGLTWDGQAGGVVAIESQTNMVIDGIITATAIGFRGGVDDKNNSSTSGQPAVTLYRSTTNLTATKGESIAGNADDYNTYLNGSNGRGAPANGGGGGNGHNTGGGGGSNASTNGALGNWNGTGLKDITTPAWIAAWELEATSFSTDISTGGGRGGYSYGNTNQDALTLAPGSSAWGGDRRNNVGGFGGRPLDYNNNSRIFMGGGGGAGEGNNNSAGNGGNGGGIIFLHASGSINGTGTITASGQNGFDTQNSNIDAAGGAGGGGAIVAIASSPVTGVSFHADGGVGGNQLYLAGEAEGPGGGGGGGFITTTATSVVRTVNGGTNGISYSALVTEFMPNGATIGASGTIAIRTYNDFASCDPQGYVLPIRFVSFTANGDLNNNKLQWTIGGDASQSRFEIESSVDGINFSRKSSISVTDNEKTVFNHTDNQMSNSSVIYYRIKWIGAGNKFIYSETRSIKTDKEAITGTPSLYPNPAGNDLYFSIPSEWQGKKIRLQIFDISGKLTANFEKQINQQIEKLDIQSLVKGVYLIKASTEKEIYHQKIIKN